MIHLHNKVVTSLMTGLVTRNTVWLVIFTRDLFSCVFASQNREIFVARGERITFQSGNSHVPTLSLHISGEPSSLGTRLSGQLSSRSNRYCLGQSSKHKQTNKTVAQDRERKAIASTKGLGTRLYFILSPGPEAASPVRLVRPRPDHFSAGCWSRSQTAETV